MFSRHVIRGCIGLLVPGLNVTHGFTSKIPVRISKVGSGRNFVSNPHSAHSLGYSRHLLLKSAVAEPASPAGNSFRGVRGLGYLAGA